MALPSATCWWGRERGAGKCRRPARSGPRRALDSRAARLAPVAQLDRASVYGTEGQRFESSRARSLSQPNRRSEQGLWLRVETGESPASPRLAPLFYAVVAALMQRIDPRLFKGVDTDGSVASPPRGARLRARMARGRRSGRATLSAAFQLPYFSAGDRGRRSAIRRVSARVHVARPTHPGRRVRLRASMCDGAVAGRPRRVLAASHRSARARAARQ
jgi:hypothetical protein